MYGKIEFINQPTKCILCGKGREREPNPNFIVNGEPKMEWVPLIKHHISYFPEKCAYVHAKCHIIIHDSTDPRYKHLIQFQEGESRRFYKNEKL